MIELDIWRTAAMMIGRHGEDAELQAAMTADEMLENGSQEGCNAWKRVLKAIQQLRGDNTL